MEHTTFNRVGVPPPLHAPLKIIWSFFTKLDSPKIQLINLTVVFPLKFMQMFILNFHFDICITMYVNSFSSISYYSNIRLISKMQWTRPKSLILIHKRRAELGTLVVLPMFPSVTCMICSHQKSIHRRSLPIPVTQMFTGGTNLSTPKTYFPT